MIVITNEELVNEKGKKVYAYKRKHNISNDPNKRKNINQEEKESNNCTIIILLLLFLLCLFLGLYFGLKSKKRDNNKNNIDNNLDNDFLDCNDDSVLVNGKCIKYSFKATYQTKTNNEKIN